MTDEEIVAEVLRDRSYFSHIVERYEAKLTRYIARLGVRNAEDQEDVLQEIFIKVYRNLNAFDPSLSFSSWIYRIAHNEAISWYRKQSVRPEGHLILDSDELLSFVSSKEDTSEQLFDRSVSAEEVGRALQSLDQRYRDVIILRYFEHKEYEEISDILKMPVGSVGTLLHRGKKALKEEVDNEKITL